MSFNISSASQNVLVSVQVSSRTLSEDGSAIEQQTELQAEQETVVISGEKSEALTYSKPRALPASSAAMLDASEQQLAAFMDFLGPLLEEQGLSAAKVATGEQTLTVDQGTIDAAKDAVSENGEFGVQQVAEKILGLAKSAMGDDPGKMKEVRAAVESSFAQAKQEMGGALPEISQETYDTIMAEFDRWENEGIPSGSTVNLASAEDTDDTTVNT